MPKSVLSTWPGFVFASALLASCAGGTVGVPPTHSEGAAAKARTAAAAASGPSGLIQRVVIIVQENRSVDNLFNGLPGADTVSTGLTSTGASVPLHAVNLKTCYDLVHEHGNFTVDYNSGGMNGFNRAATQGCTPPSVSAYGYVPQSQDPQYWTMAESYAFADRMFQTNA